MFPRFAARLITTLFLATAFAHTASGQGQVVGPGGSVTLGSGSGWIPWIAGKGRAEVTRDNPRLGYGNYGEGSLRLSVSGELIDGQYPDWAFWYRYAGGSAANSIATLANGGSFGALSQLSQLSFDWFREGLQDWNAPCPGGVLQPIAPCDWLYKTPVVRIQLAENINGVIVQSELIWEGYYNQGALGGATPVDQWVTTSNMQGGNFWYIRPALGSGIDPLYSTGPGCSLSEFSFWQGNATASALNQLLGTSGCMNGTNPQVIGIAVGVGSQWPLEYVGYVDNVRMGFGGTNVLDTNFDYIVPEPATYLLVAAGLFGLRAIRRRRSGR